MTHSRIKKTKMNPNTSPKHMQSPSRTSTMMSFVIEEAVNGLTRLKLESNDGALIDVLFQ